MDKIILLEIGHMVREATDETFRGALFHTRKPAKIIDRHIHPITRTESVPIDDAGEPGTGRRFSSRHERALSTVRRWMLWP